MTNLKYLKIISAVALFGALLAHQYYYFQILRWVVTIVASIVFYEYSNNKSNKLFIFLVIVIIFNPIIQFHFSKSLWYIIDIIVAIVFLNDIKNSELNT